MSSRSRGRNAAVGTSQHRAGDRPRLAERVEMPARQLHDAQTETRVCDVALELDREEAVIASGQDGRRDVGARAEGGGLVERDVGLITSVLAALCRKLRRHVVEE